MKVFMLSRYTNARNIKEFHDRNGIRNSPVKRKISALHGSKTCKSGLTKQASGAKAEALVLKRELYTSRASGARLLQFGFHCAWKLARTIVPTASTPP